MGKLWISSNELASLFGERVAFKSGLALTREEIATHIIANTDEPDVTSVATAIKTIDDTLIRFHSQDLQNAFQDLLFSLGAIPNRGVPGDARSYFYGLFGAKLGIPNKHPFFAVEKLLDDIHYSKGNSILVDGFDADSFYALVARTLPISSIDLARNYIELILESERAALWHWYPTRSVNWNNSIELNALFASESLETTTGTYFDQRFIEYLHRNPQQLNNMHWRQFEALTAEYFLRQGFDVELGPGRADNGVDIRAWNKSANISSPQLILVQCKREKRPVQKVLVKSLWADVVHEGATSGMIVTTSTLSPGANAVRKARSYPIQVADRSHVVSWLKALKLPGSGVFMGA